MCTEKERIIKTLEEMDVMDDFLFMEIMTDEESGIEVCRMILSLVLKREIGKISYTAQKVVPGVSESSHGIRMDAYITEQLSEEGTDRPDIRVYDMEPDTQSKKKRWLPKRSRYYGDLIDVHLLETGVEYNKLPELVTIFILSFDPFGKNAMYYEAGSIIKTHPDIPYDDGIRRIYLYVNGDLPENAGEEEKKLQNLLRYIGKSIRTNVTDENTEKLDDIVHKTKAKKGVGVRFMKSWEREKELIEEGREEMRKEKDKVIAEKDTELEQLREALTRAKAQGFKE
ncbi:MAG: Rpn family recombination-promoting nuclease/putative transposase [Lachnospiraceae bacterium]|nr:Rpn family recombination-promoting nuclease/putative transposase [Lachnospiraceae bacterium]